MPDVDDTKNIGIRLVIEGLEHLKEQMESGRGCYWVFVNYFHIEDVKNAIMILKERSKTE